MLVYKQPRAIYTRDLIAWNLVERTVFHVLKGVSMIHRLVCHLVDRSDS